MIEANQYIETVKSYFCFLTTEFDFKVPEEKIRGNAFYDVQYKDETRIVSVSYENIEIVQHLGQRLTAGCLWQQEWQPLE